jgi:hypothetical protein
VKVNIKMREGRDSCGRIQTKTQETSKTPAKVMIDRESEWCLLTIFASWGEGPKA